MLLKPVNAEVALLTALFRIVYAVVALVALLNLVSVYRIVYAATVFTLDNQSAGLQVANYLNAFKPQWHFALIFLIYI